MGLRDLEAFMRERATDFDGSMDVTAGAPFDTKVIQPLLRRVGIDPFSVDLVTFLITRLRQAYPRMALDDGDNLVDLLVHANSLLWDPLVRETTRVQRNLSLQDPTTLTLDEVDSLGGNFFVPRRRGRYARGVGRIFFGTPSNQSISQNNFFTSRGGLVFFPTELQSIRTQEMVLNITDGNLYYFDVNLIAQNPGTSYTLGPGELISVANVPAAVRVTNLQRFRFGENAETAIDYVNRLQQGLGEKSMVALRGIAAKVLEAFPDINRLNVVGFNDPEMNRDVITGGGLGPIIASGKLGRTAPDGEGGALSRRIVTNEVDFSGLIDDGSVITIVGDITVAGDYAVLRFISTSGGDSSVDLVESVLVYGESELRWFLRRRELTLSGIPGGILYPNNANGTVTIPSDSIHIGGAYDVHVRTSDFDEATLTIVNVTDDEPVLSGKEGIRYGLANGYILNDFGSTPSQSVIDTLNQAATEGWSLQILDGPNAGPHRIIRRSTTPGGEAVVIVDVVPLADPVYRRWRLFDSINIDLIEPKETRVTGTDLVMIQGSTTVYSGDGSDYIAYGVVEGDILRVLEGAGQGDYVVSADPVPATPDRLMIDREMARSSTSGSYIVFRAGATRLDPPLVRVRSVELLDSSTQPQGSFIPYAKPVDVQSRSFQNPARGVKHAFVDVSLGLVSRAFTFPLTVLSSQNTLLMHFGGLGDRTVVISAGTYASLSALVQEVSTSIEGVAGDAFSELAVAVGDERFGIRPAGSGFVGAIGGNGLTFFFGTNELHTTADVRSDDAVSGGGWAGLSPPVDYTRSLDVVGVLDGLSVGFYDAPFLLGANSSGHFPACAASVALISAMNEDGLTGGDGTYFPPEVMRSVNVGTRSIGSVRVFFLEPTSFEVSSESTIFSLDLGDAGVARFFPDPMLDYQHLPPLPDGDVPTDGATANTGASLVITSASQDFPLSGVLPGYKLVVEYWPIKGSIQLTSDPVVGLAGKVFRFSVNDGAERVLTFIRDDTSIPSTDVTLSSVVEQINAAVGLNVASVDSDDRLRFETDAKFSIKKDNTPNSSYPIILDTLYGHIGAPSFSTNDANNVSPHAGIYTISDVFTTQLYVTRPFPLDSNWVSSITGQSFRITRPGVQRITTTAMSENVAEAGLYFFDVELISEGVGDFWNIGADQQLTVDGYESDGYYLVTEDSNLTFSGVEKVKIVLSRTILEQGINDDLRETTQLTGQNLQITYERVQAIENLQNFASSDTERVVCASPLARHLIPHFIRFDISYVGGSKEAIVLADIENYVKSLYPNDSLDSSDVQGLVTGRGATYVKNPIDLLAVVHNVDRSVWIQRSQDRLSTTRLAAFIPDAITVMRDVRRA